MNLVHKHTETRRKRNKIGGKYQKEFEFLMSLEFSQKLN